MLQKVIQIENVGRFTKLAPVGDVSFRKLNLVHAPNGHGKTTICAILRSLQSGDAAPILARQTLGSVKSPTVKLLIVGGGTLEFQKGAWSSRSMPLHIFDGMFVNRNIHAADSMTYDHRRALHKVVVGEQGVGLAKKIEEIDAKTRENAKQMREISEAIVWGLPAGTKAEQFAKLVVPADIDEQLKVFARKKSAHSQAALIRNTPAPKPLPAELPDFAGIETLLSKTLDDVATAARGLAQQHIEEHLDEAGLDWLQKGHEYEASDVCPFCGQKLRDRKLIDAYSALFSEEYLQLRSKADAFRQNVNATLGEDAVEQLRRQIDTNNQLSKAWRNLGVDFPEYADSDLATLQKAGTALEEALQRKSAAPLDSQRVQSTETNVGHVLAAYGAAAEQYNNHIHAAINAIEARHAEVGALDRVNIDAMAAQLALLDKRRDPEKKRKCDRLAELKRERELLDDAKAKAKAELATYSATVLGKCQLRINELLAAFGASFRLEQVQESMTGGKPSLSYGLKFGSHLLENLDGSEEGGRPALATALSGGDRTTLALAFFFASVEASADLGKAVVVLDDPIASHDGFRRAATRHQIGDLLAKCAQVVVLSHDPHFLRLLFDQVGSAATKCLHLTPECSLAEWDIEEHTRSDYYRDYFALARYADGEGSANDLKAIAQKIRVVLEHYYRTRYPKLWERNDWLGDFVAKWATMHSGASYEVGVLNLKEYDELVKLKDYCSRYHHPNDVAVEPTELKAFVARTLCLISGKR